MNFFLKSVFLINLSILISLAIYHVSLIILSRAEKIGFRYRLRLGQFLLLASLLIPIVYLSLPKSKVVAFEKTILSQEMDSPYLGKLKKDGSRFALTSQQVSENLQAPRSLEGLVSVFHLKDKNIQHALIVIWTLGFLFVFLKLCKDFLLLRRTLKNSSLIKKIGKVRIVVSDQVLVPFSVILDAAGYVVLPSSTIGDRKVFKIVLSHELQHHRQLDTHWAILTEILKCFFYINPGIYLWKKNLVEYQEFSCDESLVGENRISSYDYGYCLVRVAEDALKSRRNFIGSTCMVENFRNKKYFKSFLKRRIEMFPKYKVFRRDRSVMFAGAFLSFLLAGTIAYGAKQLFKTPVALEPNPGVAKYESKIQEIADKILSASLQEFNAKAGFIIVSEPKTGKVLAVSNFSQDLQRDKKKWALSYQMEPASVMKSIIASSAITEDIASPTEVIDCGKGPYKYGNNLFHDWKPFGKISVTESVVQSSNICGIKIGEKLGSKKLAAKMKEFGFGATGSAESFPEATPGFLPSPSDLTEEEYVGLVSYGHNLQAVFHVTPLEIVQAYAVFANGGQLMKPIESTNSKSTTVRQVITTKTANEMKSILAEVVNNGTGRPAKSSLYKTAGKTATAFTPDAPKSISLGGERNIASFVGFAPVNDPQVVVYVGIIQPKNTPDGQPHGSEHAAPVFRKVVEQTLGYLNKE